MAGRKNSTVCTVWIDTVDVEELDRRAKERGVSRAEIVRRIVRYQLDTTGAKPR